MSAPSIWPRAIFGSAVIVAAGYGIMKATTPSEKEFYEALSPELKQKVDQRRQSAVRAAAVAEQLERARTGGSDEAGPVWAGEQARMSGPPRI